MKHSTIAREGTFFVRIYFIRLYVNVFLLVFIEWSLFSLPPSFLFYYVFSLFWFAIKMAIFLYRLHMFTCTWMCAPCAPICVHSTKKLCSPLNWINNLDVCVCLYMYMSWIFCEVSSHAGKKNTSREKKQTKITNEKKMCVSWDALSA